MVIIGLAVDKSKRTTFTEELVRAGSRRGMLVKVFDFSKTPQEQGPFDILVQKLSFEMITAKMDPESIEAQQLNCIKEYLQYYPECIVQDPLENMERVLCRQRMTELLLSIPFPKGVMAPSGFMFDFDAAGVATEEQESSEKSECERRLMFVRKIPSVTYPLICKPKVACSVQGAHNLALVFNEDGLIQLPGHNFCQAFHNHDGVIHKVYIIGDFYAVNIIPSIRNLENFDAATPNFLFDSQKMKDPEVFPFLSESHVVDPIDPVLLQNVSRALRGGLGLSTFGVDIIRDAVTGVYYIIDINYFSTFHGVPNLFERLLDLFVDVMERRSQKVCTGKLTE